MPGPSPAPAPAEATSTEGTGPGLPPPSRSRPWQGGGLQLRSVAEVRAIRCECTIPPGQAARAGRTRQGGIKCILRDFYGSRREGSGLAAAIPPLLPQPQPAADEWLPSLAFLPVGELPPVPSGWVGLITGYAPTAT